MIERDLTITNKLGLHARAAAKVVSVSCRYSCTIQVRQGERLIDAKSIMGLLTLGAAKGTTLTVQVDGEDEVPAMDELADLFERKFDEGE
ncbi:HPr family phosphocarrier protein [Alloalcanivorax gelatiniphagus]|uniref:HPr family phosphocarrier protein n=1 Tax=Alloalcanivorax gelatiniphagus TaxID=1194167 RepID=A0ABY2XHQ2_9GAMM|nr:HPr family phosphocarrier protein [Alloalcanivorax gelatiniphagus]TMW10568.1 HPr family phosphocarrier protein [Alloalcanivorax gelatiniphagus]|tara:strand:- start:935 stop:1204 length:270 start_codon:yes stop_codon:yes gene_type:complete